MNLRIVAIPPQSLAKTLGGTPLPDPLLRPRHAPRPQRPHRASSPQEARPHPHRRARTLQEVRLRPGHRDDNSYERKNPPSLTMSSLCNQHSLEGGRTQRSCSYLVYASQSGGSRGDGRNMCSSLNRWDSHSFEGFFQSFFGVDHRSHVLRL